MDRIDTLKASIISNMRNVQDGTNLSAEIEVYARALSALVDAFENATPPEPFQTTDSGSIAAITARCAQIAQECGVSISIDPIYGTNNIVPYESTKCELSQWKYYVQEFFGDLSIQVVSDHSQTTVITNQKGWYDNLFNIRVVMWNDEPYTDPNMTPSIRRAKEMVSNYISATKPMWCTFEIVVLTQRQLQV
jgi:hypothetical protein